MKNAGATAEDPVIVPNPPAYTWAVLHKGEPFWFALARTTPLFPEDGGTAPIAQMPPGMWFLAAEVKCAITTHTQDGRRGVIRDLAAIQIDPAAVRNSRSSQHAE